MKVTPVPGSQASPSPDGEPAGDGGIGDHVVPGPLHPPRDVRIGPVVPTLPVEQRGERRAARGFFFFIFKKN